MELRLSGDGEVQCGGEIRGFCHLVHAKDDGAAVNAIGSDRTRYCPQVVGPEDDGILGNATGVDDLRS